ncbi:hypothetical protein AYO43_09765 [Nitrospira sp. SCGC AG-212-E16]|nr:hypothetical protein AYO43_09765 [Nitrospira sp. SCGC AG-212-E16]
MTRLLLITLLLLSSAPAYAEWVPIDVNDRGMTTYVDPDTIRRKVEMVTMWVLIDYKTAETTVGDQSYLSTKQKHEYDCDGERGRTLTFTDFSDHMGNGKVVYSDSDTSKWDFIAVDSLGQILWKVACGKN